jgi:dipeptide transport system substrate-binding protein
MNHPRSVLSNPDPGSLREGLRAGLLSRLASRRWTGLLAALSLTLAAGAASAQSRALVFCTASDPEGFDAARWVSTQTIDAAGMALYNRLVEFEAGTLRLLPGLAEKWDIGRDGRTYTFNLRRGVKFHSTDWFKPSRDFSADDVVLSLERYRDRESAFNKAYGVNSYPYNNGWAANVASVEKVDPLTVRVTLKAADSTFLANLGMATSVIISAEYADQLQKAGKLAELDTRPVGTGPWVMRRYDKDTAVRYDANTAYWGGKPKTDRLIIQTVKDSAVRVQKLKAGECHIGGDPRPQEVETLKADRNINMLEVAGLNVGYVGFNTQSKPFDNRDVRTALAMAVNRKAIIEAVYQGSALATSQLVPPGMLGHFADLKDIPYDPEQARRLLAGAGLASGLEVDIWAPPITRQYNPDMRKTAEMMQADWARIGVKAKVVSYEWGDFLKRVRAGEHQVALIGWAADYADPDNFFVPLVTCSRPTASRWCTKEVDDALATARATVDVAERGRQYRRVVDTVHREMPYLPLAHGKRWQPVRKEVQGLRIDPLTRTILHEVELR